MWRWLSVVVAMTACSASAWHLTPVPLWQLIEMSPTVVLARVDAADIDSLELTVLETWRGQPPNTMKAWNRFLGDSKGVVGEKIIAFLTSRDGQWSVVNFGEIGTRRVGDDQVVAPMRELVKTAVELQDKLPPKSPPPVEWVALAFTDVLTRGDAREMYVPIGDGEIPTQLATRVGEAFLAAPTDDPLLVAYLEPTRNDRREQLTRAFAKSIDLLVADDMPAVWAIHAIEEFEVRITPGMKVRPRRSREDVADFFLNGRPEAAKKIRSMWAKVKSKSRAKR